MNSKKTARKPRSRSGSAASNSESELTLGSTPIHPRTESMSEHNITSSTKSKYQTTHSPSPSRAEKGAIGDGEYHYQLKQEHSSPCGEDGGVAENVAEEASVGTSDSSQQLDYSDPVFRKISRINGEINRMHKDQLRQKLADLRLHTGGVKEVLKKRLKNYYKRKKLSAASISKSVEDTRYDFLVVIDYEATCQENNHNFVHEIIEFPAVLVNVQQRNIVGMFREFCKPVLNPVLTEFCKQLTGVNQSEVDNARGFPEVLELFELWLEDRQLGTHHSFCVVTDGPWDIVRFLNKQCELSKVPFPWWGRRWVNVRKTYGNFYDCQRLNLHNMLVNLGLAFQGRPHCGLDDSKNIARIVCHLLDDGCPLKDNEKFDGGAHFATPSGCADTGDGHPDGMLKPLAKSRIRGFRPTTQPGQRKPHAAAERKHKSGKDISGPDSDEDVADLMYYFQLQSS